MDDIEKILPSVELDGEKLVHVRRGDLIEFKDGRRMVSQHDRIMWVKPCT